MRRKRFIAPVMTLAAPYLLASVEDFDSDPWTLNTPGGLVNLKTSVARPHDPKAMCSMITCRSPVPAPPAVSCISSVSVLVSSRTSLSLPIRPPRLYTLSSKYKPWPFIWNIVGIFVCHKPAILVYQLQNIGLDRSLLCRRSCPQRRRSRLHRSGRFGAYHAPESNGEMDSSLFPS